MGIILGAVLRRRWLTLIGTAVIVSSVLLPWGSAVRTTGVIVGGLLLTLSFHSSTGRLGENRRRLDLPGMMLSDQDGPITARSGRPQNSMCGCVGVGWNDSVGFTSCRLTRLSNRAPAP